MTLPTRAAILAWVPTSDAKAGIGDIRDFVRGQLGGGPLVELVIAAGAVAANDGGSPNEPTPSVTIDTEIDDPTDDLDNITVALFQDGQHIVVGLENAARVVTLRHEQGGDGQISTADGANLTLWKTTQWVLFRIDKSGSPETLREVGRFGFGNTGTVTAKNSAYTVKDYESGTTFTNEGAGAEVPLTLPDAVAGLEYTFYVQNVNGIQVNAGAGDTIRHAASVSAGGGLIEAAVIGNSVTLRCINATEWVVTSIIGAWTVT